MSTKNFKHITNGVNLIPNSTTQVSGAGDLDFASDTNKAALHNGTTASPVVTETHTATLTNKTIDAGSNTISNLTNTNLSGSAGITGANIASGTVTGTNIASATVTGSNIASATVTGSNIASNTVANSNLSQMAANSIKGNNTSGSANASDLTVSQVNTLLGTVTTVGSFGSTPNSGGASISGNTITLQPASGSQPGGVSTSSQTFAGSKTLGTNTSDATTIGAASSTALHKINGGVQFTTNAVSGTYAVDNSTTDYILDVDVSSAISSITLPAPSAGRVLIVKDYKGAAATHNITINRHSTETIDGASSLTVNSNYGSTALYSDGTNWFTFGGGSGGGSGVNTVGAFSASSQTNGASISSNTITFGPADATNPGMVSTSSQTVAGQKTFSGGIKTAAINDNGAGLALQSSTNQNLTLGTGGGTGIVEVQTPLAIPESTIASGSLPSSAPASYDKLFFGNDQQPYSVDSSGNLRKLSTAGPINYIDQIRNATSGWATYSGTAKNIPVSGTGGTATGLTLSANSTSPIRGIYDFKLVQSNSTSVQGKGVSYDFTIDAADQAKPLAITFDYNASSTFVSADGITAPLNDGTTSFNSGNSDIEVFIYDKTNSQLIYVTPQVLTANGSNNYQFKGTFQTASNSTSYRLIFHCATTHNNATGWTFKWANVFVGPQAVNYGPAVTDWKTYTLNITGTVSDPAKGTTTYDIAQWRRVGDSMEINYQYLQTGAGSAGSGTYLFSLPTGYQIDTSKFTVNSDANSASIAGHGAINNSSTRDLDVEVVAYDSTRLMGRYSTGDQYGSHYIGSAIPLSTSDWNFAFFAKVPIQGWSSTLQMSNDADTRVVAAKVTGNAGSTTLNTAIAFPTTSFDTHSAYSSGQYTAPVSGIYEISGFLTTSVAATTINLYKNGSSDSTAGVSDPNGNCIVDATISLVAGDIISLRPSATVSIATSYIKFSRLSGPSAIAATELVIARASGAAASAVSNGDPIIFPTTDFDSHGQYSISTGKYTVPSSGYYNVQFYVNAANNNINYQVWVNGSLVKVAGYTGPSAAVASGAVPVKANAGDTIYLSPSATSGIFDSTSWVSFTRIK